MTEQQKFWILFGGFVAFCLFVAAPVLSVLYNPAVVAQVYALAGIVAFVGSVIVIVRRLDRRTAPYKDPYDWQ